MTQPDRLRITEIFYSLQGEAASIGYPTVFVRLTGCPLRCQYCDTAYAFQGGEWMAIADIISKINSFAACYVCVTGGEPLAQKSCINLLTKLCELDFKVSLETSGAIDIAAVDPRVSTVMDIKTPGSGEVSKNLMTNLEKLDANDQLKFVICSRSDYEWAKDLLQARQLNKRCSVIFSPSFEQVSAKELAEWVLDDRLQVRVQVQLHKILWGDAQGR